ncbi:MAG: prephenate dehydrogenase/arogenate dehydrogenase family protein [Methanolinea sp.]|nr:prephenate dehydrogenase/arogenate dehydrogenase family protein [Methanolinea sp.]
MGRFFREVFERAGCRVLISGRNTPLSPGDLAARCDVVMVSVPIRETGKVIEGVAPLLSERQILCDLTSLKAGPVKAMLASRAQVIGLHPMFGPSVPGLSGQTIVVTPGRCEEGTLSSFLELFERQGARITRTTPEEHDRIMAVVQGLTHFVTLGIADTMRRVGIPPGQTEEFMSPVYRMEMGLVGRLLSQDPALYSDMLRFNPFVPPVLKACEESISHLKCAIEQGEGTSFEEIFRIDAEHFGEYRERAAKETDDLIAFMVKE